ncbi:NUMOD3 motif-containing protein [Halorientalis regularis]|jgi:hypothetical protein|uniref:NUMOD3 motif-containing protein n=1 Tax=Halorientalis regularis TaxID=660518 RepID=A0A1G7NJ05_9EURY|nr:NUMOD3 motif-containing protein [Halorientalis regularis]
MNQFGIETSEAAGGNHGLYGSDRDAEVKERISEALRGREFSAAARRRTAASHSGKSHPETVREKISESLEGLERPLETRRRMSESRRGEDNPAWWAATSGTTVRDGKSRERPPDAVTRCARTVDTTARSANSKSITSSRFGPFGTGPKRGSKTRTTSVTSFFSVIDVTRRPSTGNWSSNPNRGTRFVSDTHPGSEKQGLLLDGFDVELHAPLV